MAWKRLRTFFTGSIRSEASTVALSEAENATQGPLPAPPRDMLSRRDECEEIVYTQAHVDEKLDTPLAALYRLYETIMLDMNIKMRNELESFWCHSSWAVKDIPDPQDPDPERYAVLACITELLVLSFNDRISLGLPRDTPPIITGDVYNEIRMRPKLLEEVPAWASKVPALGEILKNLIGIAINTILCPSKVTLRMGRQPNSRTRTYSCSSRTFISHNTPSPPGLTAPHIPSPSSLSSSILPSFGNLGPPFYYLTPA